MNLDDFLKLLDVVNGTYTFLGYLPKVIDKIQSFITKNGFEMKTNNEEISRMNKYLKDNKKTRENNKRCNAILKKYNLPKSVGIRYTSDKDVCFTPQKTIVDKTLNNLSLKSSDGSANLIIGGGYFALNIRNTELGIVHQKVMFGTVIKHKGEIYLLRHPLGGYPNYLARVDFFINGIIIEIDDGFKVGLYY
jgi:hypothetical protein